MVGLGHPLSTQHYPMVGTIQLLETQWLGYPMALSMVEHPLPTPHYPMVGHQTVRWQRLNQKSLLVCILKYLPWSGPGDQMVKWWGFNSGNSWNTWYRLSSFHGPMFYEHCTTPKAQMKHIHGHSIQVQTILWGKSLVIHCNTSPTHWWWYFWGGRICVDTSKSYGLSSLHRQPSRQAGWLVVWGFAQERQTKSSIHGHGQVWTKP